MKCPHCGVGMQREDCLDVAGRNIGKSVPAALYRCKRCQSEFLWVKGIKGLKSIGGRVPLDVDSFIRGSRLGDALIQLERIEQDLCPDDDDDVVDFSFSVKVDEE